VLLDVINSGAEPRPGEISLAHNGVLFLDELAEWDRRALEVLREPLESGVVTISRAARQSEFPARFQLVAAMNPCPCGWSGDPSARCRCSLESIQRYRSRLSGPLMDRIDLQLSVPRIAPHEMRGDAPKGETTAAVRARVMIARDIQTQRCGKTNARLSQAETESFCRLDSKDQRLLERAMEALQLSARAMHRILRVARTIADLAENTHIQTTHLTEAIAYRQLDRGHAA
jgi:magnesium chelatase family protein